MRHYETVFIINPDLNDDDTTQVIEKFTGILKENGAEILKTDIWGRRRLAYTVKKFNKGFYVVCEFGAESTAVVEMERNFKIDEKIIRFLTVKKGDVFDVEVLARAAAAAKARAEARAAALAARGDDDEDEAMGDDDYDQEEEEDRA
jgi:small subunit ribosomal protein S6